MDLPRLFAMDRYWETHPPLRDMVQAAFFGPIEAKRATTHGAEAAEPHVNTEEDLQDFIKMFGAIGGTVE